ncbi:hypothetical protein D9757_010843 [Collybiopsis confluens]|uniref:ZZ-type domain-containing protein n=1 Tax=Collybiopsis confluens TaxID=2823264 RepID=A0A8H5GKY8_9AGAR|nr:hypothetical protein D9757_010843 [Collybiopsis confluens]
MFTVKATYRGEIRKLNLSAESPGFPTFEQLYNQLYRVFPISNSFILSRLLFSPGPGQGRVMVSSEVRTAEEYRLAVAPFNGRKWESPMLRFSVFDETPHKVPNHRQSSFPVADSSYGQISYSHIPPPPIIFSSRPSLQQPFGAESNAQTALDITQSTPSDAACCATSQAKRDIQDLLACFKTDLDRAIASLDPRPEGETTSQPSSSPASLLHQAPTAGIPVDSGSRSGVSLPSAPASLCQFNFCWCCGVIKQGPWFDCLKCDNKLCITCHATATASDCFVGTGPHVWEERMCVYCVENPTPVAAASPQRPITWSSLSLNHVGSPLLPSVPTMPPVTSAERPVDLATPTSLPSVPSSMPAVEPEGQRSNSPRIVHHGIICDVCSCTVKGVRHKCLDCPDYDLCTTCINAGAAERHNPFHEFFEISEPGRVVVHNVFSGSGEREASTVDSRHEHDRPTPRASPSAVHNATCNLCTSRIRGDRYIVQTMIHAASASRMSTSCIFFQALTPIAPSIINEQHPTHSFVRICTPDHYHCIHQDCPDFDLCQDCEALPIVVHPTTHPMLKIKDVSSVIPYVHSRAISPPLANHELTANEQEIYSRAHSPSGSYESGHMRNPSAGVEGMISPKILPPSPFYFKSESSRCPSPEYLLPTVDARTPSPTMTIPGALPAFYTLPPLESLSLSPILRTPPMQESTLPPLKSATELQEENRVPSPLWKRMPYPRPQSPPAIPGQYFANSPLRSVSGPETIYNYPTSASVTSDRESSPPRLSPNLHPSENFFPVRLPSVPRADSLSHVLPPVQSSTNSSFWPENYQEIRHLMDDEPSFSHRFPWSLARPQADEVRLPAEESPLILTRPSSSNTIPGSERSVHSLASILSSVYISSKSPLDPQVAGTPGASKRPVVPLHSITQSLSAEFVSDMSVPDGQVVAPGAEFIKKWVMRNGGIRAWPEGTVLVFVAGEPLANVNNDKPVATVLPGEEIELWTEELRAPETPGRYVSYYRLRDNEGQLFGQSIWIDITVSETSRRATPESSDEYLSSSSVIVMPEGPPTREDGPVAEPISPTLASSLDLAEEISDSDSVTSGSLLSMPDSDSDSDDELWEDSRTSVLVEGGTRATMRVSNEVQQPVDEYVVLYDESTSSEED